MQATGLRETADAGAKWHTTILQMSAATVALDLSLLKLLLLLLQMKRSEVMANFANHADFGLRK